MTTGALQGLLYCGNILIPSLFPFMVLSSFIVKSGLADFLGKFMTPITKRLFHTNGVVGTVILLGMSGGFPVGAKGVTELYQKGSIDIKTAQALSMFLVGGGGGFVVMVVGASLYKSITTGLLLWLCQVISQITTGIFACRKVKFSNINTQKSLKQPLSNSLVEATQSGVESIMSLCGLVIIFSCIFGIFNDIKITDTICDTLKIIGIKPTISESILNALWEVTKGCSSCCDNTAPIWLTAFALGWGGLCVHFQVYSIVTPLNISKVKFTLYRLAQGVITAIISAIIFSFYSPTQYVYNNAYHTAQINCNNYIGSFALIVMCIIFSISVSENKQNKS